MQSIEEAAESVPGAMRMDQPESFPAYGSSRNTMLGANAFSNCCPCLTSPVNRGPFCREPTAGAEAVGASGTTGAGVTERGFWGLLQAATIIGSARTHNLASKRGRIGLSLLKATEVLRIAGRPRAIVTEMSVLANTSTLEKAGACEAPREICYECMGCLARANSRQVPSCQEAR